MNYATMPRLVQFSLNSDAAEDGDRDRTVGAVPAEGGMLRILKSQLKKLYVPSGSACPDKIYLVKGGLKVDRSASAGVERTVGLP
jgi:hypothetical protein